LRQGEFLAEDDGASLAGYQQWSQARAATMDRASRPRFDVFRATDNRLLPEGVRIEIEVVGVERAESRQRLASQGMRFGSLVHAVLREVPLDAAPEVIEGHAETQGRLAGAHPDEIQAAADTVALTLRHPLLERARAAERLHREWPLLCRIAEFPDGVFEGVLDLAFVEAGEWQVIDFKTDAEFPGNRAAYRHQLSWYALALERLTGVPARGILLSI
jgi:ATP-dependent exoDNAse (exonuclease V) beta subunit